MKDTFVAAGSEFEASLMLSGMAWTRSTDAIPTDYLCIPMFTVQIFLSY